jgi:Zn-dependent protease with chaperone function
MGGSFAQLTKNTIKTYILLAGLGGLLVLFGSFFGRTGAVIGLVIGVLFVGASYWLSDTIAIKSARAVPVTEAEMPEYYRLVRELAGASGIPMPKLYVTPDRQPNAFATGRNPQHAAVAVTAGILEILDWDELRGVLAHELSHVGNRDILIGSVAAAVATAISFVANMAMWGAMFGGQDDEDGGANPIAVLALVPLQEVRAILAHELGHVGDRDTLVTSIVGGLVSGLAAIVSFGSFGLLTFESEKYDDTAALRATLARILIAPLAAPLLHLFLVQSREYEADQSGVQLLDGDGEALAQALLRINAHAGAQPMHLDPGQTQAWFIDPTASPSHFFSTRPRFTKRVARIRYRAPG